MISISGPTASPTGFAPFSSVLCGPRLLTVNPGSNKCTLNPSGLYSTNLAYRHHIQRRFTGPVLHLLSFINRRAGLQPPVDAARPEAMLTNFGAAKVLRSGAKASTTTAGPVAFVSKHSRICCRSVASNFATAALLIRVSSLLCWTRTCSTAAEMVLSSVTSR